MIGVITIYRARGALSESLDDAQFLADAVGAGTAEPDDTGGGGR